MFYFFRTNRDGLILLTAIDQGFGSDSPSLTAPFLALDLGNGVDSSVLNALTVVQEMARLPGRLFSKMPGYGTGCAVFPVKN